MSSQPTITDIGKLDAPWGKKVTLQNIAYESGMSLIRVRIQENTRFTDLELDPETAAEISRILGNWSEENAPTPPPLR